MAKTKNETRIIPNRINRRSKQNGASLVKMDSPDDRVTAQTGDPDTLIKIDNPDDTKFEGK